eukprot:888086-Amphidinium_carterae.1
MHLDHVGLTHNNASIGYIPTDALAIDDLLQFIDTPGDGDCMWHAINILQSGGPDHFRPADTPSAKKSMLDTMAERLEQLA